MSSWKISAIVVAGIAVLVNFVLILKEVTLKEDLRSRYSVELELTNNTDIQFIPNNTSIVYTSKLDEFENKVIGIEVYLKPCYISALTMNRTKEVVKYFYPRELTTHPSNMCLENVDNKITLYYPGYYAGNRGQMYSAAIYIINATKAELKPFFK